MNQPFQKKVNDGKSHVKQAGGEEREGWQEGRRRRRADSCPVVPGCGRAVGMGGGCTPHGAAWLRSTAVIPPYV